MAIDPIDQSQRTAAKLSGFLYLLTILIANFSEFYVRARITARGDAGQAARNIAALGQLFRIGIASDLVALAASVALIAALFVILKRINRNLVFIAALWWLVECCVTAIVIANNYAALLLLGGADSMRAWNPEQLPGLAQLFLSLDFAANRIAAVFFGLGSMLFCYLWFRSRYIPRALAAWGIVSSLVPAIIPFLTMVLPSWQDIYLRRARSGLPILSFEVMIGSWLLVKGIRNTAHAIACHT